MFYLVQGGQPKEQLLGRSTRKGARGPLRWWTQATCPLSEAPEDSSSGASVIHEGIGDSSLLFHLMRDGSPAEALPD